MRRRNQATRLGHRSLGEAHMTNEERDLITRFIERVGGAQSGGFAPGTGKAAPRCHRSTGRQTR